MVLNIIQVSTEDSHRREVVSRSLYAWEKSSVLFLMMSHSPLTSSYAK